LKDKNLFFPALTPAELAPSGEKQRAWGTWCWGSSDMWTQELAVVFTGPMC